MFDLRNFDWSGGKQMVLVNCQVLLITELIKKDNLFRTVLFYNVYYCSTTCFLKLLYLCCQKGPVLLSKAATVILFHVSQKSIIFKETYKQVVV